MRRGRGRRRRGGAPRRLKRYVHNAITSRMQPKQHFTDVTTANVAQGTWNIYTIGQTIAKGTDRGDRIGDSIQLKGVKFRFELTNNGATITKCPTFRIMLLRNREPHISSTINCFKGEGTTQFQPEDFDTTGDYNQIWKPLNRRKFAVLFDKKIKLLNQVNESQGKWKKNFTVYVPMKASLKYNPEVDAGNFNYIKPEYLLVYFYEKVDSSVNVSPSNVDFDCKITEFFR